MPHLYCQRRISGVYKEVAWIFLFFPFFLPFGASSSFFFKPRLFTENKDGGKKDFVHTPALSRGIFLAVRIKQGEGIEFIEAKEEGEQRRVAAAAVCGKKEEREMKLPLFSLGSATVSPFLTSKTAL